jgi:hypothetical protein
MSSEEIWRSPRRGVTPRAEQRGSGHSVVSMSCPGSGRRTGIHSGAGNGGEGVGKPWKRGVDVSSHLSLRCDGKAYFPENDGQSRGQNRTWEIRLSGIAGGLGETWSMAEL